MSLRARIFLLFLGFSVLPVVFLGAADYFQSVEALRAVLLARSDALAEQTGREVEAAYEELESMLAGLEPGSAEAGPFAELRWVDPAEPIWSPVCASWVPIRTSPAGSERVVEGRVPVEELLRRAPATGTSLGEGGAVQVVDRSSGALLFDSRCGAAARGDASPEVTEAVSAVVERIEPTRLRHQSLRFEDGDADLLASISAAGPWAVAVTTRAEEFVGPFRRARIYYLGLVLLVMGVAAGGFLLLAEGAFRSLRQVTVAADEIELGNLRPWLPPPGDDEVGRLSLAFRRMTERLEESLRQAELNQKLAAVGELATYLSHEIRNPLSSIRLSLQSLYRDVKAGFVPADSPRVIEIALSEVTRLDGVVRAVLEMGRPGGPAEDRPCPAHATLEDTLEVLRPKLDAQGIDLEYVPHAGHDLVEGDPAGLRSVVINLVVNAMDALDGRPDPRIRIATRSGGGQLHIRIADNGPGVSPAVAESIFEPFFTTKARGNGIGLPTALRTVQAWGGTVVHEPVAAGSGAVFVVKLKLTEPVVEPAGDENLTRAHAS